jgi:Cytochrome P460
MVGNRTSVSTFVASAVTLAALAWMATTTWVHGQAGGAAKCQSGTVPTYDPASGELCTPAGFETWVFVGSNLGLAYKHDLPVTNARESARAETQVFHNIYITPEAYTAFRTTGEFPELTMLVMEIFLAADKAPTDVLSKGVYNGERIGLQVAVKNSNRPGPHTKPWAYYIPQDQQDPEHRLNATSPAFDDEACESCHKAHASKDNVWVQFYPTLRKLTK